MRTRSSLVRPVGLIAAIMIAAAPTRAQETRAQEAQPDAEAGSVAAPGRWYTEGGCAARTGVSAARPLTDGLTEAWRFQPGESIETEPLVWDDRIVLVTVPRGDAPRERTIRVVNLHDGSETVRPLKIESDLELHPSLWGRLLAFRDSSTSLRVVAVTRSRFVDRVRYKTDGPVSGPLLYGGELYYAQSGSLERLELGSRKPTWSLEGEFRGRPSLRADHVYALAVARLTSTRLCVVERQTGRIVVREGMPVHGDVLDDRFDVHVAAGSQHVLARYDMRGVEAELQVDGQQLTLTINTALFERRAAESSLELRNRGVLPLLQDPVLVADRGIGLFADSAVGPAWIDFDLRRGKQRIRLLACRDFHVDYLKRRVAPTIVGDVVYVGDFAFDFRSGKVLWRTDLRPTQRLVPARGTLLVVSENDQLVALRPLSPAASEAARAARPPKPGRAARELTRGRAVLRDGTTLAGNLELDAAGNLVGREAGRRTRVPLDRVLWIEDGAARPVHWTTATDALRAIETLVEAQLAESYVDLARRAIRSNDPDLIDDLIAKSLQHGTDDKALTGAKRQLHALRRRPQPARASVIADIRRDEAAFPSLAATMAWDRVRDLPEDAPLSLRAGLLFYVLERDPDHAEAASMVRGMLPDEVRVGEPFVAAEWLAFAEVAKQIDFELLLDDERDRQRADAEPDLTTLREMRASWREDLMALRSERLLVIAPRSIPAAVARCASMGELVCDTLEELCTGLGTSQDRDQRLRLLLFESRDEYLQKAKGGNEDANLAWTSGYYSPADSISRLYLPSGEEAFARVMSVFAHELTHHWLEERGPRVGNAASPQQRMAQPGYWIVEGFASLIEDFVWEPKTRTFRSRNPRSDRLDLLANTTPRQRLDWKLLFGLDQVRFAGLETRPDVGVPSTWYLGKQRALSATGAFYAQAAAACHYLFHADDGAHRHALLRYVVDYYSGRRRQLEFEQAFGSGADAGELGEKIVAYAKRAIR